jgi:hypothetical protein
MPTSVFSPACNERLASGHGNVETVKYHEVFLRDLTGINANARGKAVKKAFGRLCNGV